MNSEDPVRIASPFGSDEHVQPDSPLSGEVKRGGDYVRPYWGFRPPLNWTDWDAPHWLYVIASGRDEQPVKIGISGNIAQRIRTFEAGNPYGLRAVYSRECFRIMAPHIERKVHKALAEHAMGREWFDVPVSAVKPLLRLWTRRADLALQQFIADKNSDGYPTSEHYARIDPRWAVGSRTP